MSASQSNQTIRCKAMKVALGVEAGGSISARRMADIGASETRRRACRASAERLILVLAEYGEAVGVVDLYRRLRNSLSLLGDEPPRFYSS